ncbi:Acyl-CoA dehydrogenase family member 11 [Ceratocystis fimbriata CBS 114723]|uniref:Acyl-CoA dehydrogenase family member 11 n=1 Tax=Ceratocystis fimbriata CBS 114723 TaxID=1035309 RepID=A0A2C5X594_9PEZI|nr:Acyl-CoA dehydrogenase family member 11 [Ceratocystis fimbriata CBS 114723]
MESCCSSSDSSFYQETPILENQYYDDVVFQRALNLFVPQNLVSDTRPDLVQLGRDVIAPSVFEWITDAERNTPYIKENSHDTLSNSDSQVVMGEGWRQLQAFGQSRRFVACGYDNKRGPFDRVIQFLRLHLWEASTANVTYPSAMQDGAARLLQKHLSNPALDPTRRKVFQNTFEHLTSRDSSSAWTSSQWLSEQSSGSDISDIETIATPTNEPGVSSTEEKVPLGPWNLSGFKWFSSATDSQIAVVLAQTDKGLSAFLAPMRRVNSASLSAEINGVRISRLKNKMGTRPLPTAELELDGMRGWLIGEEGRGAEEIAVILNITRVHSAIAAMGYVGRGLAIAKAYARVRTVRSPRGKRMFLAENSLHLNTLANMTAEYQGLMLLSIFCAYVLGLDEHQDTFDAKAAAASNPVLATLTPPQNLITPLLRVLTQITKAYVCKNAIPILYSCMEAMGDAGYLNNEESEYLNVSRIYRDCCVLAIWEGTTDVLSADFIRAMKHPQTGAASVAALDFVISKTWDTVKDKWDIDYRPSVAWEDVKRTLANNSVEEVMALARNLLFETAELLIVLLLKMAAQSEKTSAAKDIFSRFVEGKRLDTDEKLRSWSVVERLARDQTVVYGSVVDEDVQPRL